MSDLKRSYKLSELPDNLMLSPKFLFDWWDGVIERFGGEVALTNKSPDFKLARELWVAGVFACCKRLSSKKEHWVSAVSDEAPDALVAYFDVDHIGANRQIYQIEVTEYDNNSESLQQTLKKKMDKAYHPTTRIICYMTRTKGDFEVNQLADNGIMLVATEHDWASWVRYQREPGSPDRDETPAKHLLEELSRAGINYAVTDESDWQSGVRPDVDPNRVRIMAIQKKPGTSLRVTKPVTEVWVNPYNFKAAYYEAPTTETTPVVEVVNTHTALGAITLGNIS